ncbi:MAG TPA: hypothetical protein VF044_01240 [Actinomycetota bacterium]|nr:hypothetical protein [Gaiellaceae bacterium]
MRITIEIDGAQVEATTGAPAATGAAEPVASPEVLAAAAAVGAEDAGAAPTGELFGGMPMSPAPSQEGAALAEGTGDLAAGSAPGGTLEPEPVSVEAEDAGAVEGGE